MIDKFLIVNYEERELNMLKEKYGANPDSIKDVILLTPSDKVEERKSQLSATPCGVCVWGAVKKLERTHT